MWKKLRIDAKNILSSIKQSEKTLTDLESLETIQKLDLKKNTLINNFFFENVEDYRLSIPSDSIKFSYKKFDIEIEIKEPVYSIIEIETEDELIQIKKDGFRFLNFTFLNSKYMEVIHNEKENSIEIKIHNASGKKDDTLYEEKTSMEKLKKLIKYEENTTSLLIVDIDIYKILKESVFFNNIINEKNIFNTNKKINKNKI